MMSGWANHIKLTRSTRQTYYLLKMRVAQAFLTRINSKKDGP
jgi:hypothetical protein